MSAYDLSEDQIRFYDENGYLVVSDLFSVEECDTLLQIVRGQANEDFAAIMNLDRTIPEVRAVMKDPKIVSILDTLQRAPVVGLMSQVLFKEVGSPYASQAWNPHQDNTYPRSKPGAYITINVFLEDADKENGSLYIFPGSHKHGLLPAGETPSYREIPGTNPGNTILDLEKYVGEPVDLNFKKGDMVILNGDVVHGSYPNISPTRSRPLLSISYISEGVDFIPGKNANRMVIPVH